MIQPVPAIGTPATLPLHMLRAIEQIRTRNGFDKESLDELAASIKTVGLIQPIVVRKAGEDDYIVVAGERRMLACSLASLYEVPVLIREDDEVTTAVVQASENLQRENLTLADTAEGVKVLVRHYGTAKAAGIALGKSPAWISKHLSLNSIHPDVRALLVLNYTEDLDLLLTLNQIRKMKDGKGLEAFAKLAKGMESGQTTRAEARRALEQLKSKTDANMQDGGEPEGEGQEDKDSTGDTTTEQLAEHTKITFHLSHELAAKFYDLGGMEWLVNQIQAGDTSGSPF